MNRVLLIASFLLVLLCIRADASAGVMEITNVPFYESVTNKSAEKVCLYLWYSPGHPICNQMLLRNGPYNEVGKRVMNEPAMRGKVLVCKMKVEDYSQLARSQGVDKLPTIMMYGYNRDKGEVYKGDPTDPDEMMAFVRKALKKMEVDIASAQEDEL